MGNVVRATVISSTPPAIPMHPLNRVILMPGRVGRSPSVAGPCALFRPIPARSRAPAAHPTYVRRHRVHGHRRPGFPCIAFTIPFPAVPRRGHLVSSLLMFAFGVVWRSVWHWCARRRGDWKGVALWWERSGWRWRWCSSSRPSATSPEPPSPLITALRTGQITIDRFVRAERAAAPGMFDQRLLRNNERALRESFPDGDFANVSMRMSPTGRTGCACT